MPGASVDPRASSSRFDTVFLGLRGKVFGDLGIGVGDCSTSLRCSCMSSS
jgi:hypothetical protein